MLQFINEDRFTKKWGENKTTTGSVYGRKATQMKSSHQIADLNKFMKLTMAALGKAQAELDDLKLIGMFVDDAVAILVDRYSSFDIRIAERSSRPLIGEMNNTTIWVWISSGTFRVAAIVHQ